MTETHVPCPDIGRNLLLRHCLRRQYERDRKTDALKRPTCGTCTVGSLRLAIAARLGISVSTCGTCGSGLVGVSECPGCEDAKAVTELRRGFLPQRVAAGEVPSLRTGSFGTYSVVVPTCPECGSKGPRHKRGCSKPARRAAA